MVASAQKTTPAPVVPLESAPAAPVSHQLLAEALGARVLAAWPVQLYLRQPLERRQLALIAGGCALLFFPFLGAVGLWDPWEPHYAEVGREMLARHDWVHGWWEGTYFFSKPPLPMWLTNLGLVLSGAGATARQQPMGFWTEWGVRTPNALLAIFAVAMVGLAAGRVFGRRVGLLAALILATMPLYELMARQALTDLPFVALSTAGLCALFIAEHDPDAAKRAPFVYAFYALVGLSTLAKEIPFGVGLPGAILAAYLLLTWDWPLLRRLRIPTGAALCLAIALPWVLLMSFFPELEDEGETFVHRYWLHDNLSRLFSGVHTTTPNTTFAYFIEQLGYGLFPWSALVPASLVPLGKLRPAEPAARPYLFVALWALIPFAVVSLSATKFHHYAFPCLPPVAILVAIFLDRLLDDGFERSVVPLLVGALLFAMIGQNLVQNPKALTDLFVYNYDRPYPTALAANATPLLIGLASVGAAIAGLAAWGRGRAVIGGLAAVGVAVALYAHLHLAQAAGGGLAWTSTPLGKLEPRDVMAALFVGGGALFAAAVWLRRTEWLVAAFGAAAVGFAVYLSWVHWEELTPHWSQRDIFATYFAERKPGEPIGAYYMNWKGETFYSKNEVRQIKDPEKLREFVAEPAGEGGRHWVILEQSRFGSLRQTLGDGRNYVIRDDTDVKFFLVSIE